MTARRGPATRTYQVVRVTYASGVVRFYQPPGRELTAYELSRGAVQTVEELTLRRGQELWVQAFGRLRRGHVDKLGPARVVVTCERNRQGELTTKTVPAAELAQAAWEERALPVVKAHRLNIASWRRGPGILPAPEGYTPACSCGEAWPQQPTRTEAEALHDAHRRPLLEAAAQ